MRMAAGPALVIVGVHDDGHLDVLGSSSEGLSVQGRMDGKAGTCTGWGNPELIHLRSSRDHKLR